METVLHVKHFGGATVRLYTFNTSQMRVMASNPCVCRDGGDGGGWEGGFIV